MTAQVTASAEPAHTDAANPNAAQTLTDEFAHLERLIAPRSVVVVGASSRESSQGRRLYDNVRLHSSLAGEVYAVNPAYRSIADAPCWPSIADLPPDARPDVALVMVSAVHVLSVLEQCVGRGIPFAIVMTSGFSEAGEAGQALERAIVQLCRRTGLRVYGPNCPGLVNVRDRIGMTFSPAFRYDLNGGRIGLATQGGGLGRNILQGLSYGPGVGLWFSAGNEADLDIADFIAFMARDARTDVIAVLIEGIKDGRRLTRALAEAQSRGKPVVVLKIGRSEAGIKAAQSHTASVAGSAAVNRAVFRQFGAIEVDDLDSLLAVAHLLSGPRPPSGSGLCIYTFSGGTAALAADIAGASTLPLATFSDDTLARLKERLPDFGSVINPVDTTADVLRDPDAVRDGLRIVCDDPNVGAVLFPIPMDYGEATAQMAQAIVEVGAAATIPIVPVWMSRRQGAGFDALEQAGCLPFRSISGALAALERVFAASGAGRVAGRHSGVQAASTVSPVHGGPSGQTLRDPGRTARHGLSDGAAQADRSHHAISEAQAKQRLRDAGLPVPGGEVVHDARAAIRAAETLGYPVVMKIVSPDIQHKTDAGGVRLNVPDKVAVSAAFDDIVSAVRHHAPDARIDGVLVERMLPAGGREVLIGVHRDPAYGLILTFGLGGIFVEVLGDVAHRMVPLDRADAHALVRDIKYGAILDGARGQAAIDYDALEQLIMQVSDYAHAHADDLVELELNPVWVGAAGQGAMALDALMTLAKPPSSGR